jgi:hypothetical protein
MEHVVRDTDCPQCSAKKGEKCIFRLGEDNSIPHAQRVKAYWKNRPMFLSPSGRGGGKKP